MEKKLPKELLDSYAKGECSTEDKALLESWYLDLEISKSNLTSGELENAVKRVEITLPAIKPSRGLIRRLVPAMAAASILLMVVLGAAWLLEIRKPILVAVQKSRTISPGGNKALLTLDDGSQVDLKDAKNGSIARQGSISITKTSEGSIQYKSAGNIRANTSTAYNTVSTPAGGQYRLTLADGTGVWINAASSIRYPIAFSGKNREVMITGEVYFEVAKNKAKPFLVNTGKQQVEVLGTHFNVNAYPDEDAIRTTLLEGSVKVSVGANTFFIRPGQQSIVQGKNISIAPADLEEATGWKNGFFYFNNTDIRSVMRQISRWYHVEVSFEGIVPRQRISGKVYRNVDLAKALQILKYLDINYKIVDNKIIITP